MALTIDSGTYTDKQLDMKRRLAQTMLDQSLDTSPISSNWQGVARLAKALIGGYQAHSLDEQAKAEDQATTDALMTLPGLSQPSVTGDTATPAPQPTAAADVAPPSDLRSFIKEREKFSPSTHPDFKQNSNGYGTAALPGETEITPEEADKRLDVAIGKAKGLVDAFAPNASQAQRMALADLTYNTGTGWMASGLGAAVKAGNWPLAQRIFTEYNKAGGETQPGLVDRRKAMAPNLLITEDPQQPQPIQVADASGMTVPTAPDAAAPQLPNFAGGMPAGMTMPGATPAPAQTAASGISPSPQAGASPAVPGAVPFMSSLQIDPTTQARLKTLIANPRTRQVGVALYQELMKRQLGGSGKYGKQGAVFQDPVSHKFYTAQFAEDGSRLIREVTADGQALEPSRGVKMVDTGTGTDVISGATGETRRNVAKDVQGEAREKKVGTELGERITAQPQAVYALGEATSGLDELIDTAKKARSAPGLEANTGLAGMIPNRPGGEAADAWATLGTIKSKIRTNVLQAMRSASKTGGALGNVSDSEGKMLEENIAALDKSQSFEQLQQNLDKIIEHATGAKGRLLAAYEQTYGGQEPAAAATPAAAGAPKVRTYNPATGRLE